MARHWSVRPLVSGGRVLRRAFCGQGPRVNARDPEDWIGYLTKRRPYERGGFPPLFFRINVESGTQTRPLTTGGIMGRMTYRAGLVLDTIVVWLKRAGERGGSAGVVAKLSRSGRNWWLAEVKKKTRI